MQRLIELCTIIIQNNLGELAAQIFTTLAQYGRSTESQLRARTGLPIVRLEAGLSVLIQYHIVLFHAEYEFMPSHFVVDWHAAYVLVRTDKIQGLVSERHGEEAGRLVDQILQLGLVAVGDLTEGYTLDSTLTDNERQQIERDGSPDNATNGIEQHSTKAGSPEQLHTLLKILLEQGFLIKVSRRSFMPHADLAQLAEDEVRRASFPDGRVSGPKTAKKFQKALNIHKRKWQAEDDYSISRDVAPQRSIKRLKTGSSDRKHLQTNGSMPNGTSSHVDDGRGSDIPLLPDEMILRVNYHRCIMAFRTQRLERMAKRYLGPLTAAVYGALLRVLERKERATRNVYKINEDSTDDDDDNDGDEFDFGDGTEAVSSVKTVDDMEVLQLLDDSLDLATTFVKNEPRSNVEPKSEDAGPIMSRTAAPFSSGMGDGDSDTDEEHDNSMATLKRRNQRLAQVGMHLDLLAEHPKKFCIRQFSTGKTSVDVAALTQSLIDSDLDAMISSRHGPVATRVVRILRKYGKLEEKQIAYMSLKRLKDVRQVLANLQSFTLVDVQELPKDSQRQPSRNTYLWFFNEERVRDMYLQQSYQGMSRLLQRMQADRKSIAFKAAVDKAQNPLVKGREQELLARHERDIVKRWRDNEERMLIQLSRIDDIVALFRDFSGKDTSLDT